MPSLLDRFAHALPDRTVARPVGRVRAIEDACVWVAGLPMVRVGDRVRIEAASGPARMGEVIRIRPDMAGIMAEGGTQGLSLNDPVITARRPQVTPSEAWLGRIVDPDGCALDGLPLPGGAGAHSVVGTAPGAVARKRLGPRLRTGLNVFDTVLPIARGQRIGLFAGSGVGKSRLLARLARGLEADVAVIALIGERGREVREFVEDVLGAEGRSRSVVVAATSDQSALSRRQCLPTALAVAEHFRREGKHVLLLADSVTRHAEAHREVALAAGELPALRGYPASLSPDLMALCERAGPGPEGQGDITAVFAVLVAGSDMEEPVADLLRGTLDGHVVLDRRIAEAGRYPAVDVLRSVSRCLPGAASAPENETIRAILRVVAILERSEAMRRAGLYRKGSDAELDHAIAAAADIERFLSDPSSRIETAFRAADLLLRRAGVSATSQGAAPTRDMRMRA